MLRKYQKDKEDLEEVTTELELADEDDLVPYVFFLVPVVFTKERKKY